MLLLFMKVIEEGVRKVAGHRHFCSWRPRNLRTAKLIS
jgi:hypothetical protein